MTHMRQPYAEHVRALCAKFILVDHEVLPNVGVVLVDDKPHLIHGALCVAGVVLPDLACLFALDNPEDEAEERRARGRVG